MHASYQYNIHVNYVLCMFVIILCVCVCACVCVLNLDMCASTACCLGGRLVSAVFLVVGSQLYLVGCLSVTIYVSTSFIMVVKICM